ncbi:MAG TPA: DUF1800 domain-containing protein [Pyrinomonadaceae bacterium]|nr:DUF1800 domain-containing protein [Chloracidobacterium sp.]HQX56294.1 DUF1800 domain-containing protein [Pyrinomonadaceae bacterium]HQY67097.1 DUF1800 domain-containing protein [Pyrinomonadaceae bacterium]HRA40497.1 DUF1800 domain-containing protein [Pyrinomonadaceae bacterium]
MKGLFTSAFLFAVIVVTAAAQDDLNPNSPAPVLLSSAGSGRVSAIDPSAYPGRNPKAPKDVFTAGRDARAILFLKRLPLIDGEGANAFRVYLKQPSGRTFELQSDEILPTARDVIALSIRIWDVNGYRGQPVDSGDSWIYVTWRGMASNPLKIALGSKGGKIGPAPELGTNTAPAAEFVGYRWSADRTRFLEQATFGPTSATDARLRRIGLRTWLVEQFETPYPYIPFPDPPQMPTSPPTDCQSGTNPTCFRDRYSMIPLQQWFFREAFYGDAQLRHRTAWALSQILVTSGTTTQQSSHAIAYHKVLTNGAFGNYRDLLGDVTLSPTMGNYLDMVRSTKNNPNENYPREILQLFSIGLFQLNQDGTRKLDGQDRAIPTFDQTVINDLARVFTGWTYCNTAACANATPGIVNYKDPMVLIPANHDLSAKTLMAYPGAPVTSIPACPDCTNDAAIRAYAESSIKDALDNIFAHPNLGPFIGKLLIQQMVTSDPSPAYVARVAAAFNDNGSGTRGDMKSVIRAILLDPEARGDVKTAPRYGKLREPVQLLTNLGRLFPAKAYNGIDPSDGGVSSFITAMGQNPFNSPTVFNYFKSDHTIPGTTINAPEFELFNSGTAVKRTNFLYILGFEGLTANATDALRGTSLDYTELIPIAQGDSTGGQLVDALNTKMMHGTLTPEHRALILSAVQAVSAADSIRRVKTAVYLIAASSQYQVQK